MMTAQLHYARTVTFDQLLADLEAARAERLVYAQSDGPLQLWCYTSRMVYERRWTPAVIAARGLILDHDRRAVVATPFPKFFNVGEMGFTTPDETCEIFEKVDGSLIILFHDGTRWRTATKGALDSAQAQWAGLQLVGLDLRALTPGTTYLAEAVYPENRIVVRYHETELVMLGAYDADGHELSADAVAAVASQLGWRAARRETFDGIDQALDAARDLPATQEGFVLRFASGLRLKAKGNAYAQIHAMIARVTPLGIWEALVAGDDLDVMRRLIPEEFWWDFDAIRAALSTMMQARIDRVGEVAAGLAHLSDKEVGLMLKQLPADVGRYVFIHRRGIDLWTDAKARSVLLRDIRPDGNALPGYEPSYVVRRVAADE